ncbi:MAG: 50S ribosomal protein L10 [Planctomycetota bacterium]|nr:50S ribosomal protein L10 [Planctomycetota bacterium]
MPSKINEWMIREYAALLKEQDGIVVLGLEGLSVAQASTLRNEIRGTGAEFCVTQNRLAKVALKEIGIAMDPSLFVGPCAVVVGSAEATISAAKAIEKLWALEKVRKVHYRGAYLDGSTMNAAEAAQIAAMPDKNTLRAMLCGAIIGPARMLATVLSEVPASQARAIKARAEQEQAA